MARLVNVPLITAAVLVMAPVAHAASVLVSSALARGGVAFECRILNAGTTDVQVGIEMVNPAGDVISSSSGTVAPAAAMSVGRLGGDGAAVLYCRFNLLKGSKNKVRANACALSSVNFSGPCLSTAEAR